MFSLTNSQPFPSRLKRLGRFTVASKGKSCRIVPVGYPAFGSFPVAVILTARASFLRLRWKM